MSAITRRRARQSSRLTAEIGPGSLDSVFRAVLPGAKELLGLGERQRLEQHAVHDAEDRAVRADSEREGQDGDGCERRVLGERAEREPNVLCQLIESLRQASTLCRHRVPRSDVVKIQHVDILRVGRHVGAMRDDCDAVSSFAARSCRCRSTAAMSGPPLPIVPRMWCDVRGARRC